MDHWTLRQTERKLQEAKRLVREISQFRRSLIRAIEPTRSERLYLRMVQA